MVKWKNKLHFTRSRLLCQKNPRLTPLKRWNLILQKAKEIREDPETRLAFGYLWQKIHSWCLFTPKPKVPGSTSQLRGANYTLTITVKFLRRRLLTRISRFHSNLYKVMQACGKQGYWCNIPYFGIRPSQFSVLSAKWASLMWMVGWNQFHYAFIEIGGSPPVLSMIYFRRNPRNAFGDMGTFVIFFLQNGEAHPQKGAHQIGVLWKVQCP